MKKKFPHLRSDEAQLLGQALVAARLHYSPTMPTGDPVMWKRLNRLFVRLQPWIAQKAEAPNGD